MPDEPHPLDPEIRYHVGRAAALREHADAVADLRSRARHAWEEVLLGREMLLLMDGLSPRAAFQAAENNLASRRAEFNEEVAGELEWLRADLLRKLRRPAEDLEGVEV